MDQLISVLGDEAGALLIDCRTRADAAGAVRRSGGVAADRQQQRPPLAGRRRLRRAHVPPASRRRAMLGVAELGQATPAMVAAAEAALGPLLHRRARHVVTENARTRAAADALAGGDWRAAGALMYREPPIAARRLRGQRARARHAGRAGARHRRGGRRVRRAHDRRRLRRLHRDAGRDRSRGRHRRTAGARIPAPPRSPADLVRLAPRPRRPRRRDRSRAASALPSTSRRASRSGECRRSPARARRASAPA